MMNTYNQKSNQTAVWPKMAMICLVLVLSLSSSLKAQISGTKNIPGDYADLATALTDLNTNGVGVGGATINIAAGYTETAPSGGFVLGSPALNATLSAANTLIFQKSGAGANPLLTAYTGGTGTPSTAVQDGIFRLVGADYVTIDGINLVENAANTTNPATMEFGYAMYKLNAADGCQNNTIQNCTITLSRVNNAAGTSPAVDGSRGIDIVNATQIAATTALTVTAAAGTNSNNKIYANTIQNCNVGISVIGFAASSPFTLADAGNDIGGASLATGNTILNYGGATAAVNPAAGIRTLAQYGLNVSYNTINNNNGSGVSHVSTLRGIFIGAATSANTSITNNSIALVSAGTTSLLAGIDNSAGGTAASNTINLNNNTISLSYPSSTSAVVNAIISASSATTVNINNNTITGAGILGGTGTIVLIETGSPVSAFTNNNSISNIQRNGSSGSFRIIKTTSPTNWICTGNTIENISWTNVTSTGSTDAIFSNNSLVNGTVSTNIIRNLSIPTNGTINGIRENGLSGTKIYQNNQVYNFFTTAGGAGGATFTGISIATGTVTISNNQVYSLNSTGTTGGTSGTVTGIVLSGGTSASIFKNKIYDLSSTSTGPGIIGLNISGGTTNTVNNNLIGDLRATAASATNAIIGLNITGGTTDNVYYNTVYLNASSTGANFGTSALSSNNTPSISSRNNIFVNKSTPRGTGLTVAYRRSSTTLTNYAATSNNNLFYADIPGASNLIYNDGTNSDQTLAAFKTRMATRDAASVTEDVAFSSLSGASASFLHVNAAIQTLAESGAVNIATFTDDYDGDVRFSNPGYAGTSTTGTDIGADEFEGIVVPQCAGTPTPGTINGVASVCSGLGTALSLTGASTDLGLTYQWASATVSGGPYTNMGTLSTQATGALTVPTYYILTITCSNGGLFATTPEKSVLVNANPTIVANPSAGLYCNPGTAVAIAASGASTYTWLPATGLSATTGANVNASPNATTTYTVTGTDGNGCIGTATSAITVGVTPFVSGVTATPPSVCSGANSQLQLITSGPVNTYSYTAGTGSSLNPMTGATTVLNSNNDDTPTGAPAAIGFPFNFNGIYYTQYSVSPDGWILLGNTTATGEFTNVVTSTANNPKIYPYWDDLATGTTGNVQTLVTGTAPNRIFIVQWFVTIPRNTVGPANSTFQVWLYEANGRVEFHYGTMGVPTSGSISGGLTAAAANFQSITYSSNTVSTVAANDANAIAPSSGTIYTFNYAPATNPYTYAWSPATFLSSTTITNPLATAVTSSTNYTVTATSASGCVSSGTVSIAAGSALTSVASITPSNTVCVGSNVTLNATPTGGGAPYTYAWAGPNSFTSTAQNPVLTGVTMAAAGTYTVTISDACGANSVSMVTLTINALPTVAVAPNTGLICLPAGAAVALTASGATTYSWTPSAGLSATTGASVNASPAGNTTYTVTGTDGNGCIGTATSAITVGATPSITSVTATPSSVCSGASSQLLVTSTGPVNTYSFAAGTGTTLDPMTGATTVINSANDDTPTAASAPIGFTFNLGGVPYTNYSVSPDGWILLGNGAAVADFSNQVNEGTNIPKLYPYWDDLATGTTGNVQTLVTGTAPNRIFIVQWFVTIPRNTTGPANSTFQAWLYESNGQIEYRYGTMGTGAMSSSTGVTAGTTNFNSVTIATNSNSNSTPNDANAGQPALGTIYTYAPPMPTYSWSPATFLNNTTIANPLASGITASTTYTATVTSSLGCAATGTVAITAGAALTSSANIAPTNTVCVGANVTFSATPTGGGGPYTYAWTGPNSFTSTLQNPVLTGSTVAAAGTYTVVITDNCAANSIATVSLTVNTLPLVATTPATGTICLPGGSAITLNASGATTYSWTPSAGLSGTTGTSVSANPSLTTTYTVTGTDGNGCSSTATANIIVASNPTVTATATPSVICNGGNSQLLATASVPFTYTLSNQAFSSEPTPVTAGPSGDDAVSAVLPIGFSFNYFGTTYTQFAISTNGNIQLGNGSGTANNPTYSGAFTDVAIPNAAIPNNMVALAWDDWFITAGQITYGTSGTAPNRKLVVAFNTTGRGGGSADTLNGQIVLEETTNNVVLNVIKKGVQPLNTATQGIEDATGSAASLGVPGRQNSAWNVNNQTQVFTPVLPTFTYAWSPATFLNNAALSNPLASAVTASTSYTVTATSSVGCASTQTVNVDITPFTAVNIATVPSATVCAGTSVTLTSTPVGGGMPHTYAWSPGGATTNTITINATSTQTYTVDVTDNCGVLITQTVAVTVNPLPVLVATASAATYCNPGTAVTIGVTGADTYSWLPVTGLNVANAANVNATPLATTTYTVTGTNALTSCVSTTTVTVISASTPTLTAMATPATPVCAGDTVQLSTTALIPTTYVQTVVPFVLEACGATPGPSGDDAVTAALPIGFTFNYYGVNYTQFAISTNGNIQLGNGSGTANNPTYSTAFTDAAIPNAGGPNNMIALAWDDWLVTAGQIKYGVSGTAPNQKMVVCFNTTGRGGGSADTIVGQIILEEGTNNVVINTIQKGMQPLNTATQGIENQTGGIVSSAVAGRNNQAWTVTNETRVFSPYTGTYTYVWNPATSLDTATIANPSANGIQTSTVYSVTATETSGCLANATVSITVNPIPVVSLGNDTAVCSVGLPIILDAGNTGATYLWSTTSTTQTDTVTVGGSYNVSVTDANSCVGRDTITILINPSPVVALGIDTVRCGGSVTLDAFNTGATYVWNDLSTDTTLTVTTSGQYDVTVTSAQGCVEQDTINVTINTIPTVALGNDTLFCGSGLTLDAGNAGSTFFWNTTDATQTINVTTTGQYFVTVTSPQSCSAIDTINVTIAPAISVNIGNDSAVCATTSIILDAQNTGSTYLWSDSSTGSSLVVTTPGTYSVLVTSVDGCAAQDTVVFTDNSPVVTLSLPFATTCVNTTTNALSGGAPAGGFFSGPGVTGTNFNASTVGSFVISYTYTDATTTCSATDTQSVVVDPCIGIKQLSTVASIVVAPNPNTGNFSIIMPSRDNVVKAEMYTLDGKLIYSNVLKGREEYEMNITNLANAIYYLRLTVDGETNVVKVVKQD